MKRKSTFFAVLSLAMATTAMIAFASTSTTQEKGIPESSEIESHISNPYIEDDLVTPLTVDTNNPIGDSAKGGAVVQKYFSVNAGYGHFKIFIKNYSRKPVRVSLTHKSTGKLYFTREIPGNGAETWRSYENGYELGMRGGEYILQWSGSGYKVNGEYVGKTSSSISDVVK